MTHKTNKEQNKKNKAKEQRKYKTKKKKAKKNEMGRDRVKAPCATRGQRQLWPVWCTASHATSSFFLFFFYHATLSRLPIRVTFGPVDLVT